MGCTVTNYYNNDNEAVSTLEVGAVGALKVCHVLASVYEQFYITPVRISKYVGGSTIIVVYKRNGRGKGRERRNRSMLVYVGGSTIVYCSTIIINVYKRKVKGKGRERRNRLFL